MRKPIILKNVAARESEKGGDRNIKQQQTNTWAPKERERERELSKCILLVEQNIRQLHPRSETAGPHTAALTAAPHPGSATIAALTAAATMKTAAELSRRRRGD